MQAKHWAGPTLAIGMIAALCGCHENTSTTETPITVKVLKVSQSGSISGTYYSGTIEASRTISLNFQSAGTLAEVLVREGDRVKKGRLLAKLDCRTNENNLQMAIAKARQAEDAFNRFEPMYKSGNIPEIKMVEIETDRTQSAIAVKLAQKTVEDCSLVAPESGIVSDRSVEPGDTTGPDRMAIKMVAIDRVYAYISVPEQEIFGISRGERARVDVSGQISSSMQGTISDVGVMADPVSRTYNVRIWLDNPTARLLPGMLCNVYINKGEHPGVAIPPTALKLDENGRTYVYTVDMKTRKIYRQLVRSSGFRGGRVLISEGLREGEVIVSEGVQKLGDNVVVEPEL